MAKQLRPWSVSVLTRKIDNSLADYGSIQVQGELSQVKLSGNGHLYATLKDSEASISMVMWRSTVARQTSLPKEGTEVVVRGSLSVYAPRGQYQLTVSSVQAVGQGDLAAQFEALKQKLDAAGLFSEEHKQSLPFLPSAVGLVTASGSAALADMLQGLRTRFPTMHIVHVPAQVQGRAAAAEIVTALRRLDKHPLVDVIICGRGGGSLEDLWSFNEEAVVHALFNCATPVVSAVGHETDTTLADLVADVRAKTPSTAADMVVPELEALYEQIGDYRESLHDEFYQRIDAARQQWRALATHRALSGPAYQLNMRRQRLDELSERVQLTMRQMMLAARKRFEQAAQAIKLSTPHALLKNKQQQLQYAQNDMRGKMQARLLSAQRTLQAQAAQMEALSPLKVLQRGFAVVQDAQGEIVHNARDLHVGDKISAQLAQGFVNAEVLSLADAKPASGKKKKATRKKKDTKVD